MARKFSLPRRLTVLTCNRLSHFVQKIVQKKSRFTRQQMPAVKTTFLLKGLLDIDDICHRYGFTDPSEAPQEFQIPENVTEIPNSPQETTMDYYDAARRRNTGVLTMVDFLGKRLPEQTDIHCFWCRHPFETQPLGIPVKYVPSEAVKRYKSDNITRLTIESITESRRKILRNEYSATTLFTQDPTEFSHNTLLVENGEYITDGVCCSFNCMLAFIDDNRHDPLYSRSKMYAKRILRDSVGDGTKIIPAGSWRLLKPYGGPLDIVEFRDGFSTIMYTDLRNPMYEHPQQKSLGWLHSREVRF